MSAKRVWVWMAAAGLSVATVHAAEQGPAPETRAAMREILGALGDILPICVSAERFAQPAEREKVRVGLEKIASHADSLAQHAGGEQADFASRGAVLADDARRAAARFESGRLVDARFVALQLTESCVGCHSRLPADADAPMAAKLVDDAKLAGLSPAERARLSVATRQFDKSLDLYEGVLTSPPPSVGEAARMPDLVEYLIVAVRVKRDPDRAAKLLGKLEKRKETPPDVRRELGPWLARLRSEGKVVRETPTLARARSLVESGKRARPYSYSKAGLIDDLLASSVLHRLLEDPAQAKADRAETYYLLGLTDANVRSSPWLSDAAWYLASAIRTQPHSAVAARAFEAYEDMTILEWTGSAGTDMPEDVVRELDRLRALAAPAAT